LDADIVVFAPKLDCLCDACPSAKTAYADFTGMFAGALIDAFTDMDFGGFQGQQDTTTQATLGDTTTDVSGDWLAGMTEQEKEMMCAIYPLVSCATSAPAQLSAEGSMP